MEAPASPADPRTVLERLSRLQVRASGLPLPRDHVGGRVLIFLPPSQRCVQVAVEAAEGSEPGTPADSPTCIDDDLQGWLNEALGESGAALGC